MTHLSYIISFLVLGTAAWLLSISSLKSTRFDDGIYCGKDFKQWKDLTKDILADSFLPMTTYEIMRNDKRKRTSTPQLSAPKKAKTLLEETLWEKMYAKQLEELKAQENIRQKLEEETQKLEEEQEKNLQRMKKQTEAVRERKEEMRKRHAKTMETIKNQSEAKKAFVGPTTLEDAQAANETAKEMLKASLPAPKFKVGDKVRVGIAICPVTRVDGDLVEVFGDSKILKGTFRASELKKTQSK